jgi:hypothetical protein
VALSNKGQEKERETMEQIETAEDLARTFSDGSLLNNSVIDNLTEEELDTISEILKDFR